MHDYTTADAARDIKEFAESFATLSDHRSQYFFDNGLTSNKHIVSDSDGTMISAYARLCSLPDANHETFPFSVVLFIKGDHAVDRHIVAHHTGLHPDQIFIVADLHYSFGLGSETTWGPNKYWELTMNNLGQFVYNNLLVLYNQIYHFTYPSENDILYEIPFQMNQQNAVMILRCLRTFLEYIEWDRRYKMFPQNIKDQLFFKLNVMMNNMANRSQLPSLPLGYNFK